MYGVQQMISGHKHCKKKTNLIIFILLFFSIKIYSLDNTIIQQLIKNNREIDYQFIKNIYSINNEYSIALIKYEDVDAYKIYIFSNNDFKAVDIDSNSKKSYKYLNKCENADVYYGDFSFDETPDISWIKLRQGPVFEIYKLDSNLNIKYLELLYPPSLYYLNDNPRILKSNYINFNDFQFCIINGKRGVRVFSIGEMECLRNKITKKIEYYEAVFENSITSKYYFFYWSPSEQRYILDETVTQEQLQNAYCPEDYFAYNGLKFSKLDSKLIDADLKDLDKAQLRLMRNAVYARHGRTFKSVDLQSLWECYTWYKKNPNYSDDLLTETDKYNIEIIKSYENR